MHLVPGAAVFEWPIAIRSRRLSTGTVHVKPFSCILPGYLATSIGTISCLQWQQQHELTPFQAVAAGACLDVGVVRAVHFIYG